MNNMTKQLLQEVKNLKQDLDLQRGHDDPNYITNYICSHCSHPIYYQHGFFKSPNYWKGEVDITESTKEEGGYCLLQCLECGCFVRSDMNTDIKKKLMKTTSFIVMSPNSYEEIRLDYLETCLSRSEKQTVKILKKKYANRGVN